MSTSTIEHPGPAGLFDLIKTPNDGSLCQCADKALINDLPSEVLLEVVRHTADSLYRPWDVRPTVSRLFSLSSVCSHWRVIILRNSSFWSRIPIVQDNFSHITRLCLERSRDCLLEVTAHINNESYDSKPWNSASMLTSYTTRIRTLSISAIFQRQFYSVLSPILSSQVPTRLLHLSLIAFGGVWLDPRAMKIDVNKLFNQLSTLEMVGVKFGNQRWELPNRLRQLTLDAYSQDGVIIPECLNLCLLTELGLHRDRFYYRSAPALHYKTLRIVEPRSEELSKYLEDYNSFDNIELVLYRGRIANGGRTIDPRYPQLCDMAPILHQYNITTLTLGNIRPVDWEHVLPVLGITSNLRTLTLERFRLTQPFLSNITYHGTTTAQQPDRPGELPAQTGPEVAPTLHTLIIGSSARTKAFSTRVTWGEATSNQHATITRLHTLRLYCCPILNIGAFEAMVASYSIQSLYMRECLLEWGGADQLHHPNEIYNLRSWLCAQVPELYIT